MTTLTNSQLPRAWWREPQLAVLMLIVIGIYFTRLTTLTIRGEETHRARLAAEILETGEWIVPKQQGEVYLSRPPLQSWPIAWMGMMRGQVDVFSARFPTVMAVLLTAALVYGYARTFLSTTGAFVAAVAYPTMGQVLEIGRLAETEATFTLLVSASLLLWHWGYSRHWPASLTWSLGYAFSALASLAKGPQGPVYFAAPVIVYLAFTRDWKYLLSRAHVVGIAAFAVVLGSWQIPFFLRTDWACVRGIWMNNATERFTNNTLAAVISHLFGYPCEVLGCMLPWSLLLIGYFNRHFRASLGNCRSQVVFLLTCIVVTFPSVWFATYARGRYYMPVYPCFAVLMGLVVDRLASVEAIHPLWRWYTRGVAMTFIGIGCLFAAATWVPFGKLAAWRQPPLFALIFLGSTIALAIIAWRTQDLLSRQRVFIGALILAIMLGVFSTGGRINMIGAMSHDPGIVMAEVKQKIPPGTPMVSFGMLYAMFTYHYGTIVPVVEWPKTAEDLPQDVDYFCFRWHSADKRPQLPFEWREEALVKCDRYVDEKSHSYVIVGKRVPPATARNSASRH